MPMQNRTTENNKALDVALAIRKAKEAAGALPAQERREVPVKK